MKVIVCVDDKLGMTFNKRRQSMDAELIKDILTLVGDNRLMMNEYSSKLFPEERVLMSDDFTGASQMDYLFVENIPVKKIGNEIDELIIYFWNRRYPADMYFDIDLSEGWELAEVYEFPGNSHENIRREIYKRISL